MPHSHTQRTALHTEGREVALDALRWFVDSKRLHG